MSNIPITDASNNTRKVDVFTRTEGADIVETQAVAMVDPSTGNPLRPNASGEMRLDAAQVATLTPPAQITGYATESTLAQVRDSIRAQIDLASTIWTDNSGAFYVRRDVVNNTLGTVSVAFVNPDGTAANPGAGLRPLATTDRDVTQALFDATASGTGYSAGDLLARVLILDANNTTSVAAAIWVNLTTGATIAPPTGGTFERADESISARQLGAWSMSVSNFPANAAQESGGNLQAISVDLGAPADPVATNDTGTWSITALIKRLFSRLPLLASTIPANNSAGVPVRPIGQDIWNVSFSEVGASVLSPEFIAPIVGTGVTYNQAAGALNIVAGTNTNAEFLTRSAASWQGSLRLRISTVLSQRIANNNFAVLLADLVGENLAITINSATSITVAQAGHAFTSQSVGQSVNVGGIIGAAGVPGRYAIASVVPGVSYNLTVAGWPASGSCTATVFGHSYVRNLFTGTTATNVNFDTQRRGWNGGDTVATINSTAAPGTILVNEVAGRETYLLDQLRSSTTTPSLSTRASRVENLPDDNLSLHVFLWAFNGTAAPASSTTWTISFCAVEKFANQPVYVQGVRAQGTINPLPMTVQNAPTVTLSSNTPTLGTGANLAADVGIQLRANATGAASTAKIVAAASTNAAVVKASAGRVVGWQLQNTTASPVYVKLHNQATTPTAGASVFAPIAIPANGKSEYVSEAGIAFGTGIGITIVTGAADTDSNPVAANAVIGSIHFA